MTTTWHTCVLRICTAISIALCLLGVGLMVCAVPDTPTKALTQQFNLEDSSPFTREELTYIALVTKDYTVGSHDYDELMEAQVAINTTLQERSSIITSGMPHLDAGEGTSAAPDYDAMFHLTHERYALDAEAISHLDDVYAVIHVVKMLYVLVIAAAFACCFMSYKRDKAGLAMALKYAAISVMAFFGVMGVWACIDFNGMFNVFHSLFFTQGTWTFSWQSLLISMYPPAFWMGMGVIWFITTLTCCTLCLIIGKLLKKHSMRHTDAC